MFYLTLTELLEKKKTTNEYDDVFWFSGHEFLH